MAKPLEYNATLAARDDLEPTLAVFTVRPDALADHRHARPFLPGQYVSIGLNRPEAEVANDARPVSVRRAMSIASAPQTTDTFELYIRYVERPESLLPLTHLLWPLRPGDRLHCGTRPVGKFTVEHTTGLDDERVKIMVAAGTGLAPFLCMARSLVLRDPCVRLERMAILHGASYPTSLGYRPELERLSTEHGLRYVPTISRPKESPAWGGATGRAESLLAPERIGELETRIGLAPGGLGPQRAVVYVCGLQGTIATTVRHLLPLGFVPNDRRLRRGLGIDASRAPSIFWEQYDNTAVVDLGNAELVAQLGALAAAGAARKGV